jgi:hypothetical protein
MGNQQGMPGLPGGPGGDKKGDDVSDALGMLDPLFWCLELSVSMMMVGRAEEGREEEVAAPEADARR